MRFFPKAPQFKRPKLEPGVGEFFSLLGSNCAIAAYAAYTLYTEHQAKASTPPPNASPK